MGHMFDLLTHVFKPKLTIHPWIASACLSAWVAASACLSAWVAAMFAALPRMPTFWPFDYTRYRYSGECRPQFSLPIYTAPYPDGIGVGRSMRPGERFSIYEHRLSADLDYISARTDGGWVNLWTRYNRRGVPTGVVFADIHMVPLLRMLAFWPFDYSRYRYFGECKASFSLPIWTAPYPDGTRVGRSKLPGEQFRIYEHRHSPNRDYISARTDGGWVNLWTRYNRLGLPVGVVFADIQQVRFTPSPVEVVDVSGDAAGDGSGDAAGAGSSGDAGAGSSGDAAGAGSSGAGSYGKCTPAGRRGRSGPYQ